MNTFEKIFKKIKNAICSRVFVLASLGLIAFSSCYYVTKHVDAKNSVRIQQEGNNAPSGASSGRPFYLPKIPLFKTKSSPAAPAATEQSLEERQIVPAEPAQISEQTVETNDIKEEVPQIPVEFAAVEPVVAEPAAVEPIVESVVEPTAVVEPVVVEPAAVEPAAVEPESPNVPKLSNNSFTIEKHGNGFLVQFRKEDGNVENN